MWRWRGAVCFGVGMLIIWGTEEEFRKMDGSGGGLAGSDLMLGVGPLTYSISLHMYVER